VESQASVSQKRPDELLIIADPVDALLGGVGDLDDGVAGEVGQLHSLQVRPQVLHRVEFGGIRRQPLDREPVVLGGQPVRHGVAAVRAEPTDVGQHHRAHRRMPWEVHAEGLAHGAADAVGADRPSGPPCPNAAVAAAYLEVTPSASCRTPTTSAPPTTVQATPAAARSPASSRPVGPAHTTATSTSVPAMSSLHRRDQRAGWPVVSRRCRGRRPALPAGAWLILRICGAAGSRRGSWFGCRRSTWHTRPPTGSWSDRRRRTRTAGSP
jgi:hypothetical protein